MKATAKLRYMKGSAQKVRLVADLVRGKSVNEAVAILRNTRKVAARDLLKTLKSAVANAEQKQAHLDVDDLVVRKITVDKGRRRSGCGRRRWGAPTASCSARVTSRSRVSDEA